jgi:hypothetical protein
MKWWGWGDEGVAFTHDDKPGFGPFIREVLGIDVEQTSERPPDFGTLDVPEPQLAGDLRAALERAVGEAHVSDDPHDRVVHARGKSLRDWPPWDAFHATGRGRLHDQVVLQGGTRLWAQRLGVDQPGDPAIKRQWTEARIRATLELYLKGRAAWPTPEAFRADGFGQLRDAITRAGGIDPWLVEFGLPAPHHLRGPRAWWTDERIEAELRRFAAGRELFPTVREFRRAGQTGLLGAVRRHGGAELWAARLGLPRREQHSGRVVAVV